MYKYMKNPYTGENADLVMNTETGMIIPFVDSNPHYQTYLEWVAEGNEPEPADEA